MRQRIEDRELERAILAPPGFIWLECDGHAYEKTGEVRLLSVGEFFFTQFGMVEHADSMTTRVEMVWRETEAELILEHAR